MTEERAEYKVPPRESHTGRGIGPDLLERAIGIALEAHAGQKDKAGAPYVLHPLRLMAALRERTE